MIKPRDNLWTPVDHINEKKIGKYWNILCRCKCGTEKYIPRSNYLKNLSTKCKPCYTKERTVNDIVGHRFGKYTVLSRSTKKMSTGDIGYICRCDCGSVKDIRKIHLKNGSSTQCYSCRTESMTTHGKSHSGSYVVWYGMIRRCFNKTFKDYKYYGARGITVCERWLKFENFLSDMGDRPDNLTIDRINNDGSYEPSNCRWANMKVQANNKLRISTMVMRDDIDGMD